MCAFSTISVSLSLTIYAIIWLVQLSSTIGLQWEDLSVFHPPLWRRASLTVISFSVTVVRGLPSVKISLNHSLITRSCNYVYSLSTAHTLWIQTERLPLGFVFCSIFLPFPIDSLIVCAVDKE